MPSFAGDVRRRAVRNGNAPTPGSPRIRGTLAMEISQPVHTAGYEGIPQKALCGGIPCPFLEPLARSWSHFVGIYRQNLTRSLEN